MITLLGKIQILILLIGSFNLVGLSPTPPGDSVFNVNECFCILEQSGELCTYCLTKNETDLAQNKVPNPTPQKRKKPEAITDQATQANLEVAPQKKQAKNCY